jgi:hypothetical protein
MGFAKISWGGNTVGQLYSTQKRNRGSAHARWVRVALAGWLALCGALAHAGVITLSSSQSGSVVTVTVTDSAPADMCISGLCAADFTLGFDPAVLGFIDGSAAGDFFPFANAVGAEVLVSLFADAGAFPASNVLFTIDFNALMAGSILLTIDPIDFGVPGLFYLPAEAQATVDVKLAASAVPEPNTALLVLLALAGMAWRRQTNLAQDQRQLPTA